MSSSGSSSLPRLGPTWSQGGRGFQPPPAVPAERARSRSGSAGSSGSETKPNVNKFSVLDDDDFDVVTAGNGEKRPNSRSEALRSFQRASSTGSKPIGRSLADLAARSTGPVRTTSSSEGGSGHFSGVGDSSKESSTVKVIRFTRERLLSMRPPPKPDAVSPPPLLKHLEGIPIITKKPQDPVCWDSFEPDEIWAAVPVNRLTRSNSIGERDPPKGRIAAPRVIAEPSEEKRRPSASIGPGGGRWQRGVALPPPDESTNRGRREDAENPNELWDDPVGGGMTGAAADFSAFGPIPDDPKSGGAAGGAAGGASGDDAFDFNAMAEASRRFDMERHGSKGSDILSEDEDNNVHSVQVNPHRPLASAGTTIQSGSGDGVNVFEDFDDDTPGETDGSEPAVKSGAVDDSASSRLMKMIGVNNDAPKEEAAAGEASDTKQIHSWGMDGKNTDIQDPKSAAIPSNPWGTAIGADASQQQVGLDLSSRLEAVVSEQKAREAQIAAELQRRRRVQEEEEAKRRALHAQQEQAEAANAQQQVAAGHSQVELVLMERISTFLENSWGRSDLVSILSTLHAEDSRVIPLLGNVDSLRALIARHPNRIGLRQDPAFGTEMAVLLLTNNQWQRAREEEFQRAKQERREEAMRQAAAAQQKPRILADAPWFYSDPQNNIQGPFRGEEMRQWLEAGYFKGDLPISQQPTGPFVPLQGLFPDLVVAFKAPGNDAAAEAAAEEEKRSREAEEERIAAGRAQAEAKAAAEAAERERAERELAERAERELVERERLEREAREAAGKKQSAESAQLKMMLGLGKSGGYHEHDVPEPSVEETPPENCGRSGQSEKVQLKSNKQRQQAAAAKAPAGSQSPAWGGAASAAPKKSISEIQQEEARAAARLAMERKNIPRSSSGGWANITASKGGSTGWSSGTVKTSPAAVLTNPNAANSRYTAQLASQQQSSAQRPRSDYDKASDDFGASMPPALESWCKDQMKKLNGSDDLTLVSFCMTLTDADEIRQYLTAYLGSTPQVNNFATEFINRKNGGKGKEEWESTVKGKKGKKKK